MLRRVVALTFVTLSLACVVKVNEGGSGSPPDDKDQPEESTKPNTTGSEVAEPEVEGEQPGRASAPEVLDCPADADVDTYCTDDKKLAGRWAPVDTVRPPASAETIFEAKHADLEKQPSLVIAVEGEMLYIQRVTCGDCRRIIGHGFSGDLATMSDTQIRAVQTKLGLGRDAPLLDTADAWRKYVSEDPGKTAMSKLSTVTSP
jgi:hypothetical protein